MKKDLIAKTKEMLGVYICPELKDAANKWLGAIDTEGEKAAAEAYIKELQDGVVPLDDIITLFSSDGPKAKFGEQACNDFVQHAKDLKAQGGKYCDCPGCTMAAGILAMKEDFFA